LPCFGIEWAKMTAIWQSANISSGKTNCYPFNSDEFC